MKKTFLIFTLLPLLVSCGGEKLYNKGAYVRPGMYFTLYNEEEYFLCLTPITENEGQKAQSINVFVDCDSSRLSKYYKVGLFKEINNTFLYYDFCGLELYHRSDWFSGLTYKDNFSNLLSPEPNRVLLVHNEICGLDNYLKFGIYR